MEEKVANKVSIIPQAAASFFLMPCIVAKEGNSILQISQAFANFTCLWCLIRPSLSEKMLEKIQFHLYDWFLWKSTLSPTKIVLVWIHKSNCARQRNKCIAIDYQKRPPEEEKRPWPFSSKRLCLKLPLSFLLMMTQKSRELRKKWRNESFVWKQKKLFCQRSSFVLLPYQLLGHFSVE